MFDGLLVKPQAGAKALAGDPTQLRDMQQAQIEKSVERNRQALEKLWEECACAKRLCCTAVALLAAGDADDKDKDGVLSKYENRELIATYVKTSRDWLPRLLEETMAVGCEIGMMLAGTVVHWRRCRHHLTDRVSVPVY